MRLPEPATLRTLLQHNSQKLYGKPLAELNPHELHTVLAKTIMKDVIGDTWLDALNKPFQTRSVWYLSMEFLTGRFVTNALLNTGLRDTVNSILADEGVTNNWIDEIHEPGLGNGGLGRLAACYMSSAAAENLPVYGVGLRYVFGLFKQFIDENGVQIALTEDWTAHGEPWAYVPENGTDSFVVSFQNTQVLAVPHFFPVIGYNDGTDSEITVNPLILWEARPIAGVTNEIAAQISHSLYPNNDILRIFQEYCMVSAQLQYIFAHHKAEHGGTVDKIDRWVSIHLNDTHPVFAIPEFIRLYQAEGYSFREAFEKAKCCFNYTNHTVMPEALEKWPINLVKNVLPEIFRIIEDLNQALIDELLTRREFTYTIVRDGKAISTGNWQKIRQVELFDTTTGTLYMARIACFVCNQINGVAKIHSEIIKANTLHGYYEVYPKRFHNHTNGIDHRLWVADGNPYLAALLDKHLGLDWTQEFSLVKELMSHVDDFGVLAEFADAKQAAKKDLFAYIEKMEGVHIPSNFIAYCQVKRLHEYKRQLMLALSVLHIYHSLKNGTLTDFYPSVFIIGGKAADSYDFAKRVIQFIKDLQHMINNDPDVNDKLKLVFLTNFGVSYGQKVYAGANYSEQLSTARTEASGTGNMKLAANGAPTIGTLDGANIEIVAEAGFENNYIFGASEDELNKIEAESSYNPHAFLLEHPELRQLLNYLKGGHGLRHEYWDIVNALEYGDRFYVIYDLLPCIEAHLRANRDYALEQQTGDLSHYTRKSVINIASAGKFTSDRAIREYAEETWDIRPSIYKVE